MASRKKLEVSVIQQDFTNTEKAQARTNIDAAAISSVNKNESDIADIISSATNWQNTYGIVSTQSASWNNKIDTNTFIPVAEDVDTLKANSAKLTVTGDGQRITVSTDSNTAQVSFNSAGLASETWVSAQIDELGKFQIVSADADGKPAVQNPDDKTVYIVQESEGTSGGFTEWIWTQNGGYEQFGGFEVDLSPYQKQISAGNGIEITGTNNNFISVTGDITPYSGTGIISIQDHIISALTADIRGGNGIGVNYGDNTISLSVSADYLSANALNDLSGNWESTYNTVLSNSADWENVSLKADQTWVEENYYPKSNPSGFITGVDLTDYYTKNETSSTNELDTEFEKYLEKEQYAIDSATFLTEHQDISNKLDVSSFSTVSGSFLTSIPENYVTDTELETVSSDITALIPSTAGLASETYVDDSISGKLDSSAFSTVSSTFLTAHQSLSAYATETYVDSHTSGKLDKTEASNTYQPKGDYVSSTDFNTVSSLVEELVENSAHNEISSKNAFITVTTGSDNKTDLEFVSGDLASKSWVNENFSGDYLSATALDNLSGDWESAYNAITTSSDRWNELFNVTITSTNGTVVIHKTSGANGDFNYDLSVSSEPVTCDTTIRSENGISSQQITETGNSAIWLIGLETSAKSAIDVVTNSKSTWDSVSNKLDSSVYAAESGNFLTAHQSLEGYATTSWVEQQGYLTEHQDISNKLDTSAFSTVSGDFLTAHQSLSAYATTAWVDWNYVTVEELLSYATENYVSSNYITITGAAETYQPLGNYLSSNALVGYATESWVTSQNYLTAVDLTPYQLTANMTAYQPVGNYASSTDITGFALQTSLETVSGDITAMIPSTAGLASETYVNQNTSGKYDTTSFAAVSGTFLTGVDLTPYQTTADMINYQLTADMSGYTPTTDFSTVSGYVETLKTASSTWDGVTTKLDSTAFSTVSGNFVQSTGTSAIKTIRFVTQLPASPSTSILYLIPE